MVERCVCHNISFAELKRIATRERIGVEELSRRTGCGTTCATCRPYIAVVLATGRTELPVMSEGECARVVREAEGRGVEGAE